MQIRPEQLLALDRSTRIVPNAKLRPRLLARFGDPSLVDAGLEKCAGWGIEEAEAIEQFVALMDAVGRDFDRHPLVASHLTRSDASPELRITLACELLTPEEWEAVAIGSRDEHVQVDIYRLVLA